MPLSSALVVEDEEQFRKVVGEFLQGAGYLVTLCDSGQKAILAAEEKPFDVIISDVRLGYGPDGLDVLRAFQKHQPQTPVILMTAFGDVENAIKAIQQGAYDYISKFPFQPQELLNCVARALQRRRLAEEGNKKPKEARAKIREIVGRSPAMLEVYKLVARVAGTLSTVLVVGESGSGKELVARAIHNHSTRASGPFVAVNCTAISESLLESELFGHVRGAFTGAQHQKRGYFEEAQGGTLFLDEIGDINPKMQAQLLRVLQEGEIRRVGSTEPLRMDVRVVAATNRDLDEEVHKGRFREDLYFRINVVTIRLPPLRERPEDIPLLVDHFLEKYGHREGRPTVGVDQEAMDLLCRYGWPGNVRELENVIERALALTKSGIVLPSDLPLDVLGSEAKQILRPSGNLVEDRPTLAELEQRYVNLVLQQEGGNKKRAAEVLGIDRRTLYRTLERGNPDKDPEDKDP
ncbi:MAG TPA: sigma-54 dependent transcriptional regulator [Pseudomonadota bacterium]|jgi:DNA-binding NtrC family response regulator|nr:sigma-54 dependent transcriptional regulator [Pseudomonadota bacterium]